MRSPCLQKRCTPWAETARTEACPRSRACAARRPHRRARPATTRLTGSALSPAPARGHSCGSRSLACLGASRAAALDLRRRSLQARTRRLDHKPHHRVTLDLVAGAEHGHRGTHREEQPDRQHEDRSRPRLLDRARSRSHPCGRVSPDTGRS